MNFQTAFFHWGRGGVCVWLGGGGRGGGAVVERGNDMELEGFYESFIDHILSKFHMSSTFTCLLHINVSVVFFEGDKLTN